MKFNYNFNYLQISIKLFIITGLIFFDYPVIKQTSNGQFFYSNSIKLIVILLPKLNHNLRIL